MQGIFFNVVAGSAYHVRANVTATKMINEPKRSGVGRAVKLVVTPAHVAKAVQVATSGRVQRRGALQDCFTPLTMEDIIRQVLRDRSLNLRPSDYQKPLPDSTGYDGTPSLTCADTSRRYVLVPNVGGCFR
jgi:hypothetical protein